MRPVMGCGGLFFCQRIKSPAELPGELPGDKRHEYADKNNADNVIEQKKQELVIEDLLSIKWIWKVKAMQIISVFELAKRYFIKSDIIINTSKDILDQVVEYRIKKQEYLLSITLDWANRLINKRVVTIIINSQ